MKKLFIIITMAVFCQAGFAKSVNEVINDIKEATNAMVISFDKETIKSQLADKKDGPDDMNEVLDKIDGGTVLVIEDATTDKLKAFNTKTEELLADNSYEPIMDIKNNSEKVKAVCKKENDLIKEILFIVSEKDEAVMIYFTGSINKEDLAKLMKNSSFNFSAN